MTKAQRKIAVDLLTDVAREDAELAKLFASYAKDGTPYVVDYAARSADTREEARALFAAARALRKCATVEKTR